MRLLTCQVSWTVLVSRKQDKDSKAKTKTKTYKDSDRQDRDLDQNSKNAVTRLSLDKIVFQDFPSLSQRWWGYSGIHWTICKLLAPRFRQTAMQASQHKNDLQARCFSWCPTNGVQGNPSTDKWVQILRHHVSQLINYYQQILTLLPFSQPCWYIHKTFTISGFVQTLKCFFPGLSRTCSIHKRGLHEAENVHIQNQLSVYLHYSKETEMQYLR